jgi:hypothetical protein
MGFNTQTISNAIAISDVDPVRLAELVDAIKYAQTGDQKQPR